MRRVETCSERRRATKTVRSTRAFLLSAGAVLLTLVGCEQVEPVLDEIVPVPGTPREDYARLLDRAGLTDYALVREWHASAAAVLETPSEVQRAFRASVAIGDAGLAHAWRVPVLRGQIVRVNLDGPTSDVFLDAYGTREGDGDEDEGNPRMRSLGYAMPGSPEFVVEPEFDGAVVIRAQPKVLVDGERYTISLRVEPSFVFPVAGHGMRDVGSVFGDPRDGGVRAHHGIDIFAARGTPPPASGSNWQSSTFPLRMNCALAPDS